MGARARLRLRLRLGLCFVLVLVGGGCGPRNAPTAAASRSVPERTCVVLSVGGSKGLAHLGALRAIRESGVTVDCLYGNSMGSLVGALHASAPDEDPAQRYAALLRRYADETRASGIVSVLFGVALYFLTGAPEVAAVGSGALFPNRLDLDRFEAQLDAYLAGRTVESTSIPFATAYVKRRDDGLELHTVRKGKLSRAVRASISNPYLFKGLDLEGPIDPGLDRLAAVPVEEADATFRPTRILALNATGRPSLYTKRVRARVDEILLDACNGDEREILGGEGPAFEAVVQSGYETTRAALAALASGKRLRRGWLGVTLDETGGPVRVQAVTPASAAELAGLRAGDRLLAVDGAPLGCSKDVQRLVGLRAGEPVRLRYERGTEAREVEVVVDEHPDPFLE